MKWGSCAVRVTASTRGEYRPTGSLGWSTDQRFKAQVWNAERAPSMRRWLGVSSVLLLGCGWEGAWFKRSGGSDGLRCAAVHAVQAREVAHVASLRVQREDTRQVDLLGSFTLSFFEMNDGPAAHPSAASVDASSSSRTLFKLTSCTS